MAVWPHDKDSLQGFLEHLNRQNEAIQFTMEKEDNELVFLDVKIKKRGTALSFRVHRKSTHSDLYLQWDLNHAGARKMTVVTVRALVDRAFNLCSPKNLEVDLKYVREVLKKKSFPVRIASKYILKKCNQTLRQNPPNAEHRNNRRQRPDIPNFIAVFPYVEGLTQNLCLLLKKNNVKCVMSSRGQTLKDRLPSAKDKQPPETKPCIYQIPC